MNDLDTFKGLYAKSGIEFRVYPVTDCYVGKELKKILADVKGLDSLMHVHEEGHSGSYATFAFDKNGSLLNHWIDWA